MGTTPDDHDAREARSEELAQPVQPVQPEMTASLPDSDMAEVNNVEPRPTTVEEEQKASEPLQKSSSPQSETPKKKLCGVCNENEYKYKCSRCYLPYCSIACSTIHKATHPAEEPKPAIELKAHPTLPPKPLVARPGTAVEFGSWPREGSQSAGQLEEYGLQGWQGDQRVLKTRTTITVSGERPFCKGSS